ncbi:chorismate synthase [Helicobacter cappadocius]|uniref:Chorismate synthase n=1 Tax=Helicobacter cappadocius TaxID=3063998 RepID=A0AA90TE13_9HELI|nr:MULTISPECIES: chorismate synthase [unclassified Helicobacter]MDO7252368.1 chorismate synthase [Helicobacter sp. faydin-H75]MDP2538235.1 chorismate synthase [Helicobacter sp. faydin-H76]
MNTFGQRFRVSTFGESHGEAIGCIIDGVPAGLKIDKVFISQEVDRRKGGKNRYSTPRKESDEVEILSGVFGGISTGAPIGMIVKNNNTKSADYENIKSIFRPGHADWTYYHKYGVRDYRGGGRSSARESVLRVASGAIAKMLLKEVGIICEGGIYSIGTIVSEEVDFEYSKQSEIFSLDKNKEEAQKTLIDKARMAHNSIGGVALIKARGLDEKIPIGLGEPLYHKLDGAIASAMMGLNGVKAVEIGDGLRSAEVFGSENNDCIDSSGFLSNHSGGILGGLSNGSDIFVKVYFKPTPSIFLAQKTLDTNGNEVVCELRGRHDPCIAVRGSVVCESLLALVLADMLLLNLGSKIEHLHTIYK